MCAQVTLRQIDDVPDDSRVAHYDELKPRAKEQLFKLVETEAPPIQQNVTADLESHDVIKFTDYYEISVD